MSGSLKAGPEQNNVRAVFKNSAFRNGEELQDFTLERHADSCKKPVLTVLLKLV